VVAQDATPVPTAETGCATPEAMASPEVMASPVVIDLEASPVAEPC
jgi:hypothetical protein